MCAALLLGVPAASVASAARSGLAAAVDPATDAQFVFWPTTSGDIWETYHYHGWRAPFDASSRYGLGHTSWAPAIAVGGGQQYLFWRTSDGSLREGHYAGHWTNYSFSRWGVASSAPAVAVDPKGENQYVFWVGAGGYLEETWYHGGWHGPRRMTSWGKVGSAPSVAVADDNQQYLFWRAPDGSLHEAHHTTRWSVYTFNYWRAASAPAVAVNPVTHAQYVFWQGTSGRIHETWYSGRWRGPRTISSWGKALSSPTAGVGDDGQQYVFWETPSGSVEEAHHTNRWTLHAFTSWHPGDGRLTDEQLAGTRVIYSYRGLTPPRALIARIEAGEVGGVIFFGDNISSESQIRHVTAELQRDAMDSSLKLPLLLLTDQEGGQVRRLPGAPTQSEKQVGEAGNAPAAATQAGRSAGLNLRSVGINVNLAPVLGVYRAPGDFLDQYGRSYGTNPSTVATLGANFIRAQQQTGVAATAKHFPGLGAAGTSQNTDNRPVTLHVSPASLRSIDEQPFRSAIAAGVKLVMVSWATYPALDRSRPAGLSRKIVEGELRGRLGFDGVTITDALEAGALRSYGSTANRAVTAASAGMDLLLCSSQNPGQGSAAVGALSGALNDGMLARKSFEASANRVIALRQSAAG